MQIRIRETGAVVYDNEFRAMYPDTSFPPALTVELLNDFGADPVLNGPQPILTENQYAVYVGVEEIDGQWFTKYEARDYTPEEIAQRLQQKREGMNVTPYQAKAALFEAGFLDEVEALIDAPDTDRLIVLAWNNAIEYRRLSPMVSGIASALGWTDEQLDDLFIAAAQITA